MISRLLIANRGEIAVRIARACRELGIEVVATYSTSDRDSAVVAMADEAVHIGPPAPRRSYLHVPNLIEAALRTGADAVHPGYGFLSEDPDFAEICDIEGLTFVGPPPEVMQQMGNKATARRLMAEAGLPLLPGVVEPVRTAEEGRAIADEIGYPVIIKAAAGGGGRGMTVVHAPEEFAEAFAGTRAVARAVFRDPTVYVERYLTRARHVEVQVLCDGHGAGIHLGERDCSLQRRHQKILEEAPSPALNAAARDKIGQTVVEAIRKIGYLGVGTIEFLYEDGEFFFIEMNTRLQVEHPVTEAITGIDLVREQIRIAAGLPLSFTQKEVVFEGHAIECRINAENPRTFTPSPGLVTDFHAPGGLGVRLDSAIYDGYAIPPYYDSLVGKLIVHGRDRDEALSRMVRCLGEIVVGGIETTIPLFQDLLVQPDVVAGDYHIHWLEQWIARSS